MEDKYIPLWQAALYLIGVTIATVGIVVAVYLVVWR